MVVQVGDNHWVNPEDVAVVTGDANGFGSVWLRGMDKGSPGMVTNWPVGLVVRSINLGVAK